MRRPTSRSDARAVALALLCGVLTLSGCSSDAPPMGEVSGCVTWLGEPASAEVIFHPRQTDEEHGGRPSHGLTDADGEFTASYSPWLSGALTGQHRVLIKIFRRPADGTRLYYKDATTPLTTVELERFVRSGENRFEFHLRP